MIRLAGLAIACLTVAAPAFAQVQLPEDPRSCLIDSVPAEHAKFVGSIRQSLFPGELTAGEWVAEDPYRDAAAARCIMLEGWSPSYASPAASLLSGEVRARLIGEKLQLAGFDLSRLDAFVADKTLKELLELKWLSERDASFKKDWTALSANLDRQPNDQAERELLIKYIRNRAEADRSLKIFAIVGRADPSQYLSEAWQVLPALEAARPVIRERALTKEERAEIGKLSKAYADHPSKGGRTLANLQRLMELGQSGDKAAMVAVRDALGVGIPFDVDVGYIRLDLDTQPMRQLTERLAAMWTAMLWQRFGYDDASRKYMKACVGGLYGEVSDNEKNGVAAYLSPDGTVVPVNSQGLTMDTTEDGCGFTLVGVPASQAGGQKTLQYYDKRGSFGQLGNRDPRGDFAITGVRFAPIMGDAEFLQRKFEAHLRLRRAGLIFEPRTGGYTFSTPTLVVTRPWYDHYARATGQYADMEAADAKASTAIAERRAADSARRVSNWDSALARFNSDQKSEQYQTALMYAAAELGGDYWKEYQRLVPPPSVSVGPPSILGTGLTGGDYREVEVRSYDSSGTYTGSTRMSAAWADIMKMTSASGF